MDLQLRIAQYAGLASLAGLTSVAIVGAAAFAHAGLRARPDGADDGTQTPTTPSRITVIMPADKSTVSGTVCMTASTPAPESVAAVNYFVSRASTSRLDLILGPFTATPYTACVDTRQLNNGRYRLTAESEDNRGNIDDHSIVVTIANR